MHRSPLSPGPGRREVPRGGPPGGGQRGLGGLLPERPCPAHGRAQSCSRLQQPLGKSCEPSLRLGTQAHQGDIPAWALGGSTQMAVVWLGWHRRVPAPRTTVPSGQLPASGGLGCCHPPSLHPPHPLTARQPGQDGTWPHSASLLRGIHHPPPCRGPVPGQVLLGLQHHAGRSALGTACPPRLLPTSQGSAKIPPPGSPPRPPPPPSGLPSTSGERPG